MQCPVCKSYARPKNDSALSDSRRVDCSRCGAFEISGTAESMLESRFAGDKLAAARLSHAIRHGTRGEGEWLMITSANLDSMISRPLPDIPHAIANIRNWLAGQMGDDHFHQIPIVNLERLAAVAGVRDGRAVHQLLKHASALGEIEQTGNNFRLTPMGWDAVNAHPPAATSPSHSHDQASTIEHKTVESNCNNCGGDRHSDIRAQYEKSGSDGQVSWSETMQIIECRGCETLSVRRLYWFSEWDTFGYDPITGEEIIVEGIRESHWPPK